MTYKTKILAICKEVAADYPNWQFTAGQFKNKSAKFAYQTIDPGFSFKGAADGWASVDFRPYINVYYPQLAKFEKKFNRKSYGKHFFMSMRRLGTNIQYSGLFKNWDSEQTPEDDIYRQIHYWFEHCIPQMQAEFDFSSETTLYQSLKGNQKILDDGSAFANLFFLAAYYGDFEFIEALYRGDITTKVRDAERVRILDYFMPYLPEFKQNWQQLGKAL
ncbi:hypothetical protein ACMZOO_03635 [Catenovulum sp. SX2]|uniref:hypothetical protein n=1 Tax=Catenovulum sp. SX2 TaxID=3398614 RepID=UPI003F85D469